MLPTRCPGGSDELEGAWLHLAGTPRKHAGTGAAYLYVDDADALADRWSALPGRHHRPVDTDYGLREGSHLDPDGNLLRFGSWLPGHGPRSAIRT